MARTGKASLFIIFVTVFIDLLGFGIIMPLLPRYGDHFIDSEQRGLILGLLMSSFSAMQFLFAPIWGRISDRIGRRPIILLGLAGSTISYSLFGVATGWDPASTVWGLSPLGWLFLTRIGAGIAGATIPTAQAYIADVTDAHNRGKGMAMIGAAFGIGFTFGPLLGAFFVSGESEGAPSTAPGYVAGALSGLAFLFALFKLPESRQADSESTARGWLSVSTLVKAIGKPAIGQILFTIFLCTFAFAQLESTMSLLTKHYGLNEKHNFYVFAYIGLLLTLSQGMLVRRLLPLLGEYKMSVFGVVLMVLGFFGVALIGENGTITQLYFVLPLSVLGYSALSTSIQSLLSLRSSDSDQGGILGLGQSMSAIARILGPLLGMYLFERSVTQPYWSGGVLMVVGMLLVFTLPKKPLAEE